MKKDSMIGRRLYAFLIDVLVFVMFTFLIDGLVSTPIINSTTDVKETFTTYRAHVDEYNEIMIEYGLASKDENGKLTYVQNPDKEKQDNFLKDPKIITLREVMPGEQNKLIVYFIVRVICSISAASFITFYIAPLCFRRGRTLGKFIAKLAIVDKDYSYITWYKLLLRYFISTITNIFLFILTMGIVPIILLIVTINQKDNQNIYDKLCKVYVIDGKVPSYIIKETQCEEEKVEQ